MPNRMHDEWLRAKKQLSDQVADFKKNGGLNSKPVEDALKSFDGGFGPMLEKLGTAYKGNRGADVQKYATSALTIAEGYMHRLEGLSNERGRGAQMFLRSLLAQLAELKAKGMTAKNYF